MKTKTLTKKLLAVFLVLCTFLLSAPAAVFADETDTVIKHTEIYYDSNDAKYGTVPKGIAGMWDNTQHFTIACEYWEELYKSDEDDSWQTAAKWYSDENMYGADDKKFETFEYGKRYSYSVVFKADEGYTFADVSELTFDYFSLTSYNVYKMMFIPAKLERSDDGKTLTAYSLTTLEMTPITKVVIDLAKLYYKAGEAPEEHAMTSAIDDNWLNYQVYDEYWEQMESDGNGGVVPVKYWHSNWDENNKVPEDKKITVFEEGKTYMYSIILKAVDGHMFSRDCTMELNDIKIKQSLVNLPTRDEYTLFAFALKTMRPSSADIQTVDSIDIKNLKTDYQPGESPVTSATLSAEDAKKVKIVYECWRDGDAYWYSDEAQYAPENERITEFQKGGRYSYNIYFIAKDGYEFADNVRVTLDGAALPWGAFATTTQNNWNLRVTHAATLRPGDPIERIYVSDATLNFNAGDKPVFTGKTDDSLPYFVTREWWEPEDGKGYETFEEGKKYYYGIYIRLTEEGVKEGLHFDENTKLSINNQDFDLSNAEVDIDGETIWISRLFSITPQKSGEKPKLGDANGDGVIDINDAILTARADVGSAVLGADSAVLADVNGDGKATIHDALLIVRFGLGLIEKFPIEIKL